MKKIYNERKRGQRKKKRERGRDQMDRLRIPSEKEERDWCSKTQQAPRLARYSQATPRVYKINPLVKLITDQSGSNWFLIEGYPSESSGAERII